MHGTVRQAVKGRRNRSAVSSGRRLFAERTSTDSPRGRRFIDLVASYTDDLGGNDRIDEATRNHIRRIALLQCILEDREAEYVKSGLISMEQTLEYQRTSNTQSRLMERIGLFNARSKADDDDVSPLEYAARGKTRRARPDDGEDDD